jgi:hypothetical protein
MSRYICFTNLKHLIFWNGGSILIDWIAGKKNLWMRERFPPVIKSRNIYYNYTLVIVVFVKEILPSLEKHLLMPFSCFCGVVLPWLRVVWVHAVFFFFSKWGSPTSVLKVMYMTFILLKHVQRHKYLIPKKWVINLEQKVNAFRRNYC